jgi:hypothetical protein
MNPIACLVSFAALLSSSALAGPPGNPFARGWEPAPVGGSFAMEDHIVWCGSVIRHDDGTYYMFASRWPKKLGMSAWVTHSEVVLASSEHPGGPYRFEQVLLPARGAEHWDGRATHNPNIHRHQGRYVMFYTGVRYDFPQTTDKIPDRSQYEAAWNHKRIGVATAPAPQGPWKRLDHPVLEPRPGKWDGAITSNPAVVIHPDGSVLLLYKSAPVPYPQRNQNRLLSFGFARADSVEGPYQRLNEDSPLRFSRQNASVEDPYLWHADGVYQMVAKAMDNKLVPSSHGFHAWSKDGVDWQLSEPAEAYSMAWTWSDGRKVTLKKRERPQVLFHAGKATHVAFATTTPEGGIFNTVVEIKANDP